MSPHQVCSILIYGRCKCRRRPFRTIISATCSRATSIDDWLQAELVRCVGAPEMQPLAWFSSMPGGRGGSVGMVGMLLLLNHRCRMFFTECHGRRVSSGHAKIICRSMPGGGKGKAPILSVKALKWYIDAEFDVLLIYAEFVGAQRCSISRKKIPSCRSCMMRQFWRITARLLRRELCSCIPSSSRFIECISLCDPSKMVRPRPLHTSSSSHVNVH